MQDILRLLGLGLYAFLFFFWFAHRRLSEARVLAKDISKFHLKYYYMRNKCVIGIYTARQKIFCLGKEFRVTS